MEGPSAQMEERYSYSQKVFVSFYDQMVDECYGGTSARDVREYASLLQQQLEASAAQGQDLLAVDLGCGSGATLAFVERLVLMQQPACKLRLHGVDNSDVFLEAERAKCSAFMEQHPSLQQWVTSTWALDSFETWELPQQAEAHAKVQQHARADFILLAAAGLHHVTSTAGVRTALQQAARWLAPGGLCVISYLPWAELYRQDSPSQGGLTVEEFRVRGFRRVLLGRELSQHDDGSCVLRERFALSKLAGDGKGKEEWRMEEGWQLRRLEQDELLALAAEAGLKPCHVHLPTMADGNEKGDLHADEQEHGCHYVVFQHVLCKSGQQR